MELIKNQGFKQTEVGLIPEDWDFKFHDDVASTIDSLHQTPKFSDSGFPMVRVTDIKLGYLDLKNTKRVSQKVFEEFTRNYLPQQGDVVMSRVGSYGIVSYVNSNEKFCLGQNTVVINPKINSKYLYYILSSQMVISQIELESYGTGYKSLSLKNIKELKIPIPPTLEEQKAIATALSDVDELISNLDHLITKKKAIKQGAMQQLLTPPHKGGVRLEGFSGEWEEKTIKEIVLTPVTDGPHETPRFVKEGIPFLSVNNIVNNKINYSDLRYISKEDDIIYSKKCKPKKYDILLGKAASVGKVAVVENDLDINIWSPLALIRCKSEYHYLFVFYSFQTSEMYKQIDGLTNSSSQGNIGMGDIEKLKIIFPNSSGEQKAISKILYDMDLEIKKLESKKVKYQSVKQGMMQELLTGKTRLI